MLLVDVATRHVLMATDAQLKSSWSDSNTTAHTAQLLAKKIGGRLEALMAPADM